MPPTLRSLIQFLFFSVIARQDFWSLFSFCFLIGSRLGHQGTGLEAGLSCAIIGISHGGDLGPWAG